MAQTSEKLQALAIKLAHVIRDVPDYPRPGILFKDISTLLADVATWKETIDAIVEHYRDKRIEVVGGIEARGFLLGVPIAMALGVPFIMFRKPGALPVKSISAEYVKEYSSAIKKDVIEIAYDAIKEGQRVLVVDDLIATGGTCVAACSLIEKVGGVVVGCAFITELVALKGRELLESRGRDVFSILKA